MAIITGTIRYNNPFTRNHFDEITLKAIKEDKWYKNKRTDKVWWLDNRESIGTLVFSFDKKHVFYLFPDYPWKLTEEQIEIFDKENPYWANFFRSRMEDYTPPKRNKISSNLSHEKKQMVYCCKKYLTYVKSRILRIRKRIHRR